MERSTEDEESAVLPDPHLWLDDDIERCGSGLSSDIGWPKRPSQMKERVANGHDCKLEEEDGCEASFASAHRRSIMRVKLFAVCVCAKTFAVADPVPPPSISFCTSSFDTVRCGPQPKSRTASAGTLHDDVDDGKSPCVGLAT